MTHNSYYPMSFPSKENFLDETLILTFTLSLPKRQDAYKILAAMNMKSSWFMLPSGLEKYLRFIHCNEETVATVVYTLKG